MEALKYLPLAMGLAIFTLYYFLPEDKNRKAGLFARIGVAAVSTILVGALFNLFLGHHYEFKYVYENSNNALKPLYTVSATWAGQAGTLMIWYWLTAMLLIVMRPAAGKFSKNVFLSVSVVLLMLGVFLACISPFELLPDTMKVTDGMGLNPLLINPWMAIHPPMVFVGYALVTAPFAIAVAGVMGKDYTGWTRMARPWALVSWAFLGLGIFLGSYWAYEVLGWGGYWSWDPVENASIFPWIAMGGLVHGLIIQGGKKRFAFWNIALALLSMIMVVAATFLTRSGALSSFSVHSFEKSELYYPLLIAFVSIIAYSVVLAYIGFTGLKASSGEEKPVAAPLGIQLLSWTVLTLVVFLAFVIVGTFYPLLSNFLSGTPTTVRPNYYNATSFLIAVSIGGLLIICPFVFLKNIKGVPVQARYGLSAAGAVLGVVLLALAKASSPVFYLLALLAGAIVPANIIAAYHFAKLKRWNAASYAVHLGVGLFLIGVMTTVSGNTTKDVKIKIQETKNAGGADFTFVKMEEKENSIKVWLQVKMDGSPVIREITPDFPMQVGGGGMIHPEILRSGGSDLYIAPTLIEPVDVATPTAQMPPAQGKGNAIVVTNTAKVKLGDFELQFDHWESGNGQHGTTDHSKGMPEGMGAMSTVDAVVNLYKGAEKLQIKLPFSTNPQEQNKIPQATLPDGTMLRARAISVEGHTGGTVTVQVTKPGEDPNAPLAGVPQATQQGEQIPQITMDVIQRPFVVLLWWGMIFITFGTFFTLLNRKGRAAPDAAQPEQA